MAEKCKECGCKCGTCGQDSQQHYDMHLHAEIEHLHQRLLEKDNHIVTMETQFLNEADKFPNGELASMKEELLIWQEKYSRLHEAHKRIQKVNQNLEDKLLRIVDKCETEKGAFTKDIATLSHRLADANYTIHRLTQDNEKYRNDVSLAIQLLQCKPSNFVGHKYDSLPSEVQAKVRTYVAQKRCSAEVVQPDVKSITVPISTFPPTAMVYNITKPTTEKHSDDDDSDDNKPPVNVVSAAIMAKVLEDREKERIFAKHCDTCTCHRSILMIDAESQTCLPNASSFSEQEHQRSNIDKQTPQETLNGEKRQNTDKLQPNSAISHTVFYEINENTANINDRIRHHVNGDCAKYAASLCIKDKLVVRNCKSTQDGFTEENYVTKASLNKKNLSQNHVSKCSPSFSRLNDLNRINVDRAKPLRVGNKKCDLAVDDRSTYWKSGKNDHFGIGDDLNHVENQFSDKERTHIEIINDRLWKNEWTKFKSEVNAKNNKCKTNCGVELDIINDRDWKNDRSDRQEVYNATQFTLIEVKSPENSASRHDDSQTEMATSPSFSSDSMVISSSDPSSSCSDVTQSLISGAAAFNSIKCSSTSSQSRTTGPRNCLVRVTSGSNNILLDNAGQYKTVLYSNVGGKTNTALVHTKKTSRASSERSTSTSSEDNSPMLLQDNQLQRVAEWVQSSLCVDDSTIDNSNKTKKHGENIMSNGHLSLCLNNYPSSCETSTEQNRGLSCNVRGAPKKSSKDKDLVEICYDDKVVDNERSNISSLKMECVEADKCEDLITFEVLNEQPPKDSRKANLDYEVKITKEMEETYLKLAASLDPVKLSLSNTSDIELTIEKYRKNHRKLHRVQDKAESKT